MTSTHSSRRLIFVQESKQNPGALNTFDSTPHEKAHLMFTGECFFTTVSSCSVITGQAWAQVEVGGLQWASLSIKYYIAVG